MALPNICRISSDSLKSISSTVAAPNM
jgi:hypothetical protein